MQKTQQVHQVSDFELSKQERLTKSRLSKISTPDDTFTSKLESLNLLSKRPKQSLIHLMNWAKEVVYTYDKHHDFKNLNYKTVINNKIAIDGSFLKFVEKTKAQIVCILPDAITSWASEYKEHEAFLSSGIFKISKDNLSFYVCSLFSIGANGESEVNFFCFVPEEKYFEYTSFRNSFDEFETQRDRNSSEIEVIGSDPVSYQTDLTWDDVFLPKKMKEDLKNTISGFLDSKELYNKMGVSYKKGLIFAGERGLGKTLTLRVIMSVFPQLKPVTIQLGQNNPNELLMAAFDYAEQHSPALIYLEDLQELVKAVDLGLFLQLLDGVKSSSGILTIATGNDFDGIETNLKSRPSRFDRFFEFPMPNKFLAKKYLNKYFQNSLDEDVLVKIVELSLKNKLSYSHLQEIYFNSVFSAISEGREQPNSEDAKKAVITVVKEKDLAEEFYQEKSITEMGDLN